MKSAILFISIALTYLVGYNAGMQRGYKLKECESVSINKINECLEGR